MTEETSTTSVSENEYSLAGSEFATEHFNRRTISRDAALVVPHLRAGTRLVDFGCGAGSLTCGFAGLVAPGEVVGFDTSAEAIGRARALAQEAGLRNVQFSVANIYDLELPVDTFDVAHFSGVVMHLREPERALRLAFRSLKLRSGQPARTPSRLSPSAPLSAGSPDWACAVHAIHELTRVDNESRR